MGVCADPDPLFLRNLDCASGTGSALPTGRPLLGRMAKTRTTKPRGAQMPGCHFPHNSPQEMFGTARKNDMERGWRGTRRGERLRGHCED